MPRTKNPISELRNGVLWKDYHDKRHFNPCCTLAVDKPGERLTIAKVHDEEGMKRRGIVYVLAVDGRILKIGQSMNTFRKRLTSYNSGKEEYFRRRTAGGANYFILQLLLKVNKPVDVYGFHIEEKEWCLLGEKGKDVFPSAKIAEGIFTRRFVKKYGKLPVGNGQL